MFDVKHFSLTPSSKPDELAQCQAKCLTSNTLLSIFYNQGPDEHHCQAKCLMSNTFVWCHAIKQNQIPPIFCHFIKNGTKLLGKKNGKIILQNWPINCSIYVPKTEKINSMKPMHHYIFKTGSIITTATSRMCTNYHITKHIYPRPTFIDGVVTSSKLFSCLDHTFPVHLFYQLYMQETSNLNITGLVQ